MIRHLPRLALVLIGALVAVPALAQIAPSVRFEGVITAVDAQSLTLKTADGQTPRIELAPDARVSTVDKASLADIKQGEYIGTAARAQRNGVLSAVEVHIFPPSQNGAGEGFHPNFAPVADSSMTNASVTSSVDGVDGRTLTLTYKGGAQKVIVTPATKIVRFGVGDRSDLKPGAEASVSAQKLPDGTLQAARVEVTINGASLPF